MKKIIALALALIMALSMASVAFAAEVPGIDVYTTTGTTEVNGKTCTAEVNESAYPGEVYEITVNMTEWKLVGYDFTTGELEGASLIESVKVNKAKDQIRVTIKESYTMALETGKSVKGIITIENKTTEEQQTILVALTVNNDNNEISGAKKAKDADDYEVVSAKNTVRVMDEDGGYVYFAEDELSGVVKVAADEKVYLNLGTASEDTQDAINEYLGEDYEAIVEYYEFETRAFKNEVAFSYDAYAEDPHYFYAWDGEKLVDLEATYNDDEEVLKYEFTAAAEGAIIVTDVEVVAAAEEETKNPDTGANDVVGVAAALAVVSLVAAGAVSLKK